MCEERTMILWGLGLVGWWALVLWNFTSLGVYFVCVCGDIFDESDGR